VAVLLDNFVTASIRMLEEERERQLAESKSRKTINSTLDPLLERLARDFIDNADLSCRLQNLFKVIFQHSHIATTAKSCRDASIHAIHQTPCDDFIMTPNAASFNFSYLFLRLVASFAIESYPDSRS
jgi:hypothetical protein